MIGYRVGDPHPTSAREQCREKGLNYSTYYTRRRAGLSHEEALNQPLRHGHKWGDLPQEQEIIPLPRGWKPNRNSKRRWI